MPAKEVLVEYVTIVQHGGYVAEPITDARIGPVVQHGHRLLVGGNVQSSVVAHDSVSLVVRYALGLRISGDAARRWPRIRASPGSLRSATWCTPRAGHDG